ACFPRAPCRDGSRGPDDCYQACRPGGRPSEAAVRREPDGSSIMEREQLLRALAAWRDGIDPLHGSVLPPDHPAQRADFLRVVCAAIDAIARSDVAHRSAGSTGRANAGRPWSPSEDALLTQAHAAGMSVAELARAH